MSLHPAVEDAIYSLTHEDNAALALRVAGRTDAGVHAVGQVVSAPPCNTLWGAREDHP